MKNETQLERYKKLTAYIDENFKEGIDIKAIEDVCHYSYRNINRIFSALHNETIGKYIKRIRLEKAAQYLKYSNIKVSEIAFEVGFENASALTKAFKSKFDCSPLAFRKKSEAILEAAKQGLKPPNSGATPIDFSIAFLPDFEMLCLEYRGLYDNLNAIEDKWEELLVYCEQEGLLSEKTVYMAELQDDNEISDNIHFRYNCAVQLQEPLQQPPKGLFKVKKHKRQKYTKFIHQGSHTNTEDTYEKIYTLWMTDIKEELKDLSTIEIYSNFEDSPNSKKGQIEIYIPIY